MYIFVQSITFIKRSYANKS